MKMPQALGLTALMEQEEMTARGCCFPFLFAPLAFLSFPSLPFPFPSLFLFLTFLFVYCSNPKVAFLQSLRAGLDRTPRKQHISPSKQLQTASPSEEVCPPPPKKVVGGHGPNWHFVPQKVKSCPPPIFCMTTGCTPTPSNTQGTNNPRNRELRMTAPCPPIL